MNMHVVQINATAVMQDIDLWLTTFERIQIIMKFIFGRGGVNMFNQ